MSPEALLKPKPQLLRGRARVRELAEQAEAERKQVEAELIRDLCHQPSATERVTIEVLSAQIVRGRRMRAMGRHEAAEMAERLVLRGLGKIGVRSQAKQPFELESALRALGHKPPGDAAAVCDEATP